MNQSRFPTLASAAAALATQMALASGAQAAVVPVTNISGAVTGADGLVVDGNTYDVTFEADTGQSPPTPFFASVTMATDASTALGTALSTFRSEGDDYIVSCPMSSHYVCTLITPAPSVFGVALAVDTQSMPVDFIHTLTGPPDLTTGPTPRGAVYAIWASAPSMAVPEPTSMALLGVGMAGLAAARAVRRKKTSG
jgi:hypothetical protein